MRLPVDERRLGVLLVLPSLAMVTLFALLPLLWVAWSSLHRHLPVFRVWELVGFENYATLLTDGRFLKSLANTTTITVVSVFAEIVLGLALALLLDRSFSGRGWLRAGVLLPWALPTVVAANLWGWILNPGFGILNHCLRTDIDWLGEPRLALGVVIFVDLWKSTPFAAFLLLAGLQTIPRELYHAAMVDGAGPFRRFSAITLPLLAPTIAIVALLRSLDAFRIFDVVYVLTAGGPANATETTSIYAYKLYFQESRYGYASTVSMTTFLLMAIGSVLYVRLIVRRAK